MRRTQQDLVPRNGDTPVVGIVARISGCANQKELSLEDQEDHGKEVVAELYDGPVEYRVVATKGKGEALDRPELAEIEKLLRTRELDLLVMEDVGRLVRGVDAVRLWGIAVDHGVRCIAPNDCCDTADDSWEEDLISACRDHVGHNAHTSKRLKKKLMNRFKKFGGATALPIAGYIKAEDAKTYDDWRKDEAATPIIQAGLDRLEQDGNCSAVADMFNSKGFSPGPYCRNGKWDGSMVRRYYKNSILQGMPARGHRHTIKHHENGRRVSVKNPNGAEFIECPHLAHVDPDQLDRVNAFLKNRNAKLGRKPVNGNDPLKGVPRKRTVFPGQHARCWYCGHHCVWGANGIKKNLMCSGAREWKCWNSIGFDGPQAVDKIIQIIVAELYGLEGFDAQWKEFVEAAKRERGNRSKDVEKLQRDVQAHAREQRHVMEAVASCGSFPLLQAKLQELDSQGRDLTFRRRKLEREQQRDLLLPDSVFELRTLLEVEFAQQAVTSQEFGDLLRLLVPQFFVYVVRHRDGGHLLPRAKLTLNLGAMWPDVGGVEGLSDLLTREVTLDLFEPPQRERIRRESAALAAAGVKQRDIARQLSEPATQAAVQKAIASHKQLMAAGLESPYGFVDEPPDDYPKLRRHKNAKYCFEPLEGYVRPAL